MALFYAAIQRDSVSPSLPLYNLPSLSFNESIQLLFSLFLFSRFYYFTVFFFCEYCCYFLYTFCVLLLLLLIFKFSHQF